MVKPILYGLIISHLIRPVLLTAKESGLKLEFRNIYLLNGEHKTKDFSMENPQHTIPILDDNGKVIYNSYAICLYLIEKYAKDDSLYPKDLYKRSLVDQRLQFDSGILHPRLHAIAKDEFPRTPFTCMDKLRNFLNVYDLMDKFIEKTYLVGNSLTIADLGVLRQFRQLTDLSHLIVMVIQN